MKINLNLALRYILFAAAFVNKAHDTDQGARPPGTTNTTYIIDRRRWRGGGTWEAAV